MPAYSTATNAPMPNLENLKKQAKRYLRWRRERYYPVAARIRALLPRFSGFSDCEVLEQAFKLADAQELVARARGFESWAALSKDIQHMTDDRLEAVSKSTLVTAEPQLFTQDMPRALAFYTEKLGFTLAFRYGEPPFYAQVFRDGARLNLRHVDKSPFDAAAEQLLSGSIALDDAKPLFLEFQAAGVDFAQTLRTEPWGARTFIVRDPDGNFLLFAGAGQ